MGGITCQKGAHDIVRIASEFRDISFVLVGDILDDFRLGIELLPDNISILPQKSHNEVFEEMRKSDFFIFLSHSEGFPNAVLEAMACALPIANADLALRPIKGSSTATSEGLCLVMIRLSSL